MDALAVILLDFPPFDKIADAVQLISFVIGASRARQILSVISTSDSS